VDQPETILEHRMGQPPQLGCKTYHLSPEDPSSLQSCQLGNHTNALDATNNTTTPGAEGAWPRIKESKQEHPVVEQDKSSKDEQKMTPDKNEPYCWTHNADDYSPGLIYDHQAIGQEGSKINPNLVATIANFPATKDVTNLRDLIGLVNRFNDHNPELQHTMAIWQLFMKKSNKYAWSASRRDDTRCYSLARPPEDDANGHAPEKTCVMPARSPTTTTGKTAMIHRAASRKPNINGTYNVNGKIMPLLEHTSDTHPAEPTPRLNGVTFKPVIDHIDDKPPATPSRPSSSITHSKKSTCMATGRNPFKPPKPRRAFKLHHATIKSTPLQLHGKLGIVALTRTNFNIRRASTRHRQCAAELPHSYITLAAAAKPHHAYKIKFLEDYYPHVLVT
jgi:hypothetical protein